MVWFFDWDLDGVDWLFVTAMVLLVRYGVLPLTRNRGRTATQVRAFLRRPAGALSVLYLLVFAFAGLVGPDTFFALEYPRLKFRYQPPVFAQFPMDEQHYYNCAGQVADGMCNGTLQYPLGTAPFGENMLRVIVQATRQGLELGVTAGMIMAVLASSVGTLAGYYGGLVDDVLMGYVDIQQTVPAIVIYLVLATLWFGNMEGVSDGGMLSLILVFGLLNWGGIARLVRSGVLKRREKGYVRAAKAAGASDRHVIRRHIVPNSKATIVTSLTRQIPLLVLAQVALAFLNLNRVDSKSLGRLFRFAHIGHANRQIAIPWHQKWWISVFPVLFLIVTVVAFNVLGDTLRDVLAPREKVE
jgi:peptide/nickel transport system permease protein